jgi:AraC-like DNA-binding protein
MGTSVSHDSLLFNVHDLVLLMTAGQYLLLAALLMATRRHPDRSSYWLAAILLVTALHAVDSLLIWSDPLRQMVLAWNPSLFFLGSSSYWLGGPLLYWYVSSVLYRDFHFRRWDLAHLIPAAVMGVLLIWQYYLLPLEAQVAAMADLSFMWSPLMTWMVTGWHASVIIYGSICLAMLWQYRKELHQQYANVEDRERGWLTWIILGFMIIATWRLLVHLVGSEIDTELANILGIASNYITFVFVTSLVFISIRYTHLFSGLAPSKPDDGTAPPFKDENIRRIERAMEQDELYLDADITMESLARHVSLPERTVSRILNQHFGKNFFEFINHHRVEKAKQLLAHPGHQGWTILRVLAESGFTSKSTFNAIFKKQVGQTPSQYRKQYIN